MPQESTPSAMCECGCGLPAPISEQNDTRRGYVRGQPRRFRSGHNRSKNVRHDARERFFRFVHPEPMSGCHLWSGSINVSGYGQFTWTREDGALRQGVAHRAAWVFANGAIPDGLCVLHRCDVRCCVNPDHLFLGTKSENTQDMVRKGRGRKTGLPRGVSRSDGRFMARLYHRGATRDLSWRQYLGTFDTPAEALAAIAAARGCFIPLLIPPAAPPQQVRR